MAEDAMRNMVVNVTTRMAKTTKFGNPRNLPNVVNQATTMYDELVAEGQSRMDANRIALSKVYAALKPHFMGTAEFSGTFDLYK